MRISLNQTDLSGNRFRRQTIVTGDHGHAKPRLAATPDCLGDFRARRIHHGRQPHKDQIVFSRLRSIRSIAVSQGQHAISFAGQAIIRLGDLQALVLRQRLNAGTLPDILATLQRFQRCAFGEHHGCPRPKQRAK